MKQLSKEARGFVEGITSYIRSEGKAQSLLPKVESLFQKVTSQALRHKRVHVETAVALTVEEKEQVQSIVTRLLGHPVELECRVNNKLLGGLKVHAADWILDTSFLGQLDRMANVLK